VNGNGRNRPFTRLVTVACLVFGALLAAESVSALCAAGDRPDPRKDRKRREAIERDIKRECASVEKPFRYAEAQLEGKRRRGTLDEESRKKLEADRERARGPYCECLLNEYAGAGLDLPKWVKDLCDPPPQTAPAEPGDPPAPPAPPEPIHQKSPEPADEANSTAPEEPRPRPAPRAQRPARPCPRQFNAYVRASNEYDLAGPRRSDSRRRYAELLEAFNDWCDCLKEKAPAEYERLCRNGLAGFPPPEDTPGSAPSGPTDPVQPPSVPQTPQAPNAPGAPAPNAPGAPCEGALRMPATHSGNATVRFTQHGSDHAKHCNVCLLLIRGFAMIIERNGCDVTIKVHLAPENPPLSFQCQASEVAAGLQSVQMECGPIQGQFCLTSPDVIVDNAKIVDGVVKEFDLTFRYTTPGGPETLTVRVTPPPLPEM
jgi:hypothetical protein